MKKTTLTLLVTAFASTLVFSGSDCPQPQPKGYDDYGYNYNAHMFNGCYDNYRRPDPAHVDCPSGIMLMMKWNEPWLSKYDCDEDGKLDRHYGSASYIGSGAWLTNHMQGEYEGDDGKKCHWTYFVKIRAKTSSDETCEEIWGSFCVIEEVENDPCAGYTGMHYKDGPGLGWGSNFDNKGHHEESPSQ